MRSSSPGNIEIVSARHAGEVRNEYRLPGPDTGKPSSFDTVWVLGVSSGDQAKVGWNIIAQDPSEGHVATDV
eukprot:9467077-Pyramimonas_sp.AAC.1